MGFQIPVQSVPITTKIVSLNSVHGDVYSIQHYVIKFVSDLRQVDSFLIDTPVSSTNKTDLHDIAEILLKVALNTITLTPYTSCKKYCQFIDVEEIYFRLDVVMFMNFH